MAEDFGREIAACPDCGERRTEFSVHVCMNVVKNEVNAAFAAMATDEDYRKEVQELEEFPGEPSASESAVDVAIRLVRERASMPTLTAEDVQNCLEYLESSDYSQRVADRLNAILAVKSQTRRQ